VTGLINFGDSSVIQQNQGDRVHFGFGHSADDDVEIGLDDDLRACVKSELEPHERLLWAARPGPPPVPTIAAFPAFFTALLCGVSGFALAVVFGIYGLVSLPAREASFVFGFGPAAIGFFIFLALVGRRLGYLRTRWRLARSFYCLTDRRAIVGLDHGDGEPIWFSSLPLDRVHDALCIEHEDGSGDVYFVGDEIVKDSEGHKNVRTGVVWPELGFVGVPAARDVAARVRSVLAQSRRQQ
jgi:hypothetical protein